MASEMKSLEIMTQDGRMIDERLRTNDAGDLPSYKPPESLWLRRAKNPGSSFERDKPTDVGMTVGTDKRTLERSSTHTLSRKMKR